MVCSVRASVKSSARRICIEEEDVVVLERTLEDVHAGMEIWSEASAKLGQCALTLKDMKRAQMCGSRCASSIPDTVGERRPKKMSQALSASIRRVVGEEKTSEAPYSILLRRIDAQAENSQDEPVDIILNERGRRNRNLNLQCFPYTRCTLSIRFCILLTRKQHTITKPTTHKM